MLSDRVKIPSTGGEKRNTTPLFPQSEIWRNLNLKSNNRYSSHQCRILVIPLSRLVQLSDSGVKQPKVGEHRLKTGSIFRPLHLGIPTPLCTIPYRNFHFLPPVRWLRFSYIVAIQYIHWRWQGDLWWATTKNPWPQKPYPVSIVLKRGVTEVVWVKTVSPLVHKKPLQSPRQNRKLKSKEITCLKKMTTITARVN